MIHKIKLISTVSLIGLIATSFYQAGYASYEELSSDDTFKEQVVTLTSEPLQKAPRLQQEGVAPKSPTMSIRSTTLSNKKLLDMEKRLDIKRPLAQQIRASHRQNAFNNLDILRKGIIIYDDGSSDIEKIQEAFNTYFRYDGQLDKMPHDFKGSILLLSDKGQHATAVAMSLLQAYHRAFIISVGGDNVKGDYSGGRSVEGKAVRDLEKILSTSKGYKDICHTAQVLNCSYGMEGLGNFKTSLDEGGLWKIFWDKPGTVVIQSAGNSKKNMSDQDMGQETAQNMINTYEAPAWRGRLIHAMASKATALGPVLASFSNYYGDIPASQSIFSKKSQLLYAQDNTLLAPGDSVLIPGDPFDENQDKNFFDNQLHMWNGTSAAAPMVSGSVARLVNEFNLSGQEAAAIVLESADFIREARVKTLMKNLNLGAALEEALRRQIAQEITKGIVNKGQYFENLVTTYFKNYDLSLDLDSTNFLLNAASRLGILNFYKDVKDFNFKKDSVYTLAGKAVSGTLTSGFYVFNTGKINDYKAIYIADGMQPVITKITHTRKSDAQYSFSLEGQNLANITLQKFFVPKGILASTLEFVENKITVTIDPQFRGNRRFILEPRNILMATTNDLFFNWAWSKIAL